MPKKLWQKCISIVSYIVMASILMAFIYVTIPKEVQHAFEYGQFVISKLNGERGQIIGVYAYKRAYRVRFARTLQCEDMNEFELTALR